MLSRKIIGTCGIIATLMTTACAADQTVQQRPRGSAVAPAANAQTLMYCDNSPGALFWAETEQRLATRAGKSVTFETEPGEFVARLGTGQWSRVLVFAKHSPADPAYARALREYAGADRMRRVEMYIWHDHGTAPPADSAVTATMAHVCWFAGGYTSVAYGEIANKDPKAGERQPVRAFVFPNFQGIETKPPEIVWRMGPKQGSKVPRMISLSYEEMIPPPNGEGGENPPRTIGPCELDCFNRFMDAIETCNTAHNEHVAMCNELYGPGGEGDPGDPSAWISCLNDADTNLISCRNAALNRYNLCLAVCAKTKIPPSEPTG